MSKCNHELNRVGESLRGLCFAIASLAFAPLALAQPYNSETTATQDLNCSASGAGSCTSNDFAAAVAATSSSNITSCQFNQPVVLDVVATVTSQTPARYNVGLYIGQAGNDPTSGTGLCSVNVFGPTDALLAPNTGWFDNDGNTCGDFHGSMVMTSNLVHNVKVACVPDMATGNLSIPFVLVWSNNDGACTGPGGATPVAAGTGSKCTGSPGTPITGVVVTYNADPACGGKTVTYDPVHGTVTSTFTVQNNDPMNAVPADNADNTTFEDVVPAPVVVTGVTCVPSGGASGCTVGNAGNDVTGTIAVFPTGSSALVTITGTVPAGNTGSYSNTATVTPPADLTAGSDSTGNNSCNNSTPLPVKLQSFDVH